ncbi:hypothetical protein [Kineococcus sp. SYSU DK005]|uniref:hypothetical protein n=1 Tax=Kineococcus sp. SYSU DK005 TaxID=3383126 RepID=UPI003D7CD3B6
MSQAVSQAALEDLWRQVSVHRAVLQAQHAHAAARALLALSAATRSACAQQVRHSARLRERSVLARLEEQVRFLEHDLEQDLEQDPEQDWHREL